MNFLNLVGLLPFLTSEVIICSLQAASLLVMRLLCMLTKSWTSSWDEMSDGFTNFRKDLGGAIFILMGKKSLMILYLGLLK